MPWRGPEYPGEFPTLGHQVADFIEAKCVIPDGDFMGEPFVLTDEMVRNLLWVYRLDPRTGRFVFDRGDQLVRSQKWGKGPFTASRIGAEAHPDGPVLFAGWDAAGEPVGRGWATPWIQVTAVSEDQADNVWRALLGMIREGDLLHDFPDTGDTRVNLPDGGLIEPVTSSAQSRLGQRITFAPQDETHSWNAHNGGRKVADTQRRNVAGMGGRFHETSNAWDTTEESVAQQTAEGNEPGVYRDDVEPGEGSIRNKRERRRMLKKVYGDSATAPRTAAWRPWVNLDRIESEVVALLKRDPAQAERFFLNRKEAAEAAAFDPEQWQSRVLKHEAPEGALVVVGVDGARFVDALGMVATEVATGHQWPLGIWERPEKAPHDYQHPESEVDGALSEAFERFDVWRVYIDPQYIEDWVDKWQGRWGDKRVVPWRTNRPRPICWAVRNYTEAIGGRQQDDVVVPPELTHDGDPDFDRHIRNARKYAQNVYDEEHRQMHTLAKDGRNSPRKIDAAMAGVLSWEARGDAIAAGLSEGREPLVAWISR